MKTLITKLFVLISLIVWSVSCSYNAEEQADIPSTIDYDPSITTSLVGVLDNSAVDLTWQTGDAITITDGENSAVFEVASGIGTPRGLFRGYCSFAPDFLKGASYPSKGWHISNVQADGDWRSNVLMEGVAKQSPDSLTLTFSLASSFICIQLDFTDDAAFSEENIEYLTVSVPGVGIVGSAEEKESELTVTFRPGKQLNIVHEVVCPIYPSDFSQAQSLAVKVGTGHYTCLFNCHPSGVFAKGASGNLPIDLGEFSKTTSETPMEGEVQIINESPMTNLDDGGTSNCYIVSSEGRYSFDATVMGNGDSGIITGAGFTSYDSVPLTSSSISPSSAELLWQDSEGLVGDVRLITGRVSFLASAGKGNAVIVVKDDAGEVMWSWHIWLTDVPVDQAYKVNPKGNAWTLMDRNLGATSAEDNNDSYGVMFQWGRKDPIPGAREYNSLTEPTLYGQKTAVEILVPDATTGTIAYSIKHPMTFLKKADWLATSNNSLWGNPNGATEFSTSCSKTIYDPCPAGYKVPGKDVFTIMTKTGANTTDVSEHNTFNDAAVRHGWYVYISSDSSGDTAWYPTNCSRNYNSGSLVRASYWFYWTSAPDAGTQAACMRFKNDWKEIDPLDRFQRGNAHVVRCSKIINQ